MLTVQACRYGNSCRRKHVCWYQHPLGATVRAKAPCLAISNVVLSEADKNDSLLICKDGCFGCCGAQSQSFCVNQPRLQGMFHNRHC